MKKSTKQESNEEIKRLIKKLKKIDDKNYSKELAEELREIKNKLISAGESAVPPLIELLNNEGSRSRKPAVEALGEIGDERAIPPLTDVLEDEELGGDAMEALLEFGPTCIPKVIEKVKHRITHPITENRNPTMLTMYPLFTIGKVKCEESVEFLNNLLDDYISETPDKPFDPRKKDWKYVNVDFFHILDAMVSQQDERAIPHIKKAKEFFPERYIDYKICQKAIDRIKKKDPESAFAYESVEMAVPADTIMKELGGIKSGEDGDPDAKFSKNEFKELNRCPNCDLDLPPEADYCPDCGRKIK